jgi:adenine-specific DNA-methyltransferase
MPNRVSSPEVEHRVIKYLGSKRTLLPLILEVIRRTSHGGRVVGSVVDLFSGTARVGHALKREGYRVLANDHNAYAATLARCYVEADREEVLADAERLVREWNAIPATEVEPGYFTETFCMRSRFVHPRNGARIDTIRERIERAGLEPDLKAVMLVSLMEAADRVDSTTGVQMAYLKEWAPRSRHDLTLRVPDVLPRASQGKGEAFCMDARDAVHLLEGDVVYIDPPYNQHSYLGNYHVWETLVRWDRPEVFGVACKRVDVRERQSVFNSRPRCGAALAEVIAAARAPVLVVSFNNEGFLTREAMESSLRSLWGGEAEVTTIEVDFKRYVGAQIGIHNPRGEKIGRISHLRNREYLFVASREPLASRLAGLTSASPERTASEGRSDRVRTAQPGGEHREDDDEDGEQEKRRDRQHQPAIASRREQDDAADDRRGGQRGDQPGALHEGHRESGNDGVRLRGHVR